MKHWRLLCIVLLGLAVMPSRTFAQQEETFNWQPHNFTITLPDTWVAVEDGPRLVLGEPDDVNQVVAGAVPGGLVLTVHIAPDPLDEDFPADFEFTQFIESEWVSSLGEGNGLTMHVAEIPPLAGGRVGFFVLIEPRYIITAMAPGTHWDQTSRTLLDNLFANIWISPELLPHEPTLSQQLTWRDIRFSTPRDWFLANLGNKFQMISSNFANHRYSSATFRVPELRVSLRDLSYLRPLLNGDSLLQFKAFGYDPDRMELSSISTLTVNGLAATSVDILKDGLPQGRALLLLTPRHAYLFVGHSDPEPWAASESRLFEMMLQTVVIE
jgi:hypothetical protein